MIDPELQAVFDRDRSPTTPLSHGDLETIFDEASRAGNAASTRRLSVLAMGLLLTVGAVWTLRPKGEDVVDVAVIETTAPASAVTSAAPEASAITVDIPNGLWVNETLPALAEQINGVSEQELRSILNSGTIDPPLRPGDSDSWEGLLMPGSYQFDGDVEAGEVVKTLTSRLESTTQELAYSQATERTGYSSYEVLIVASIVEAEATRDADRAKVARVIYNRLDADWHLGIDSPLYFDSGDRDLEITSGLLSVDSPYNLRIRRGLPPTPIGTASVESLKAAINPAPGEWTFYVVADREGSLFFTDDAEEFRRQVSTSIDKGLFEPDR